MVVGLHAIAFVNEMEGIKMANIFLWAWNRSWDLKEYIQDCCQSKLYITMACYFATIFQFHRSYFIIPSSPLECLRQFDSVVLFASYLLSTRNVWSMPWYCSYKQNPWWHVFLSPWISQAVRYYRGWPISKELLCSDSWFLDHHQICLHILVRRACTSIVGNHA